VVLQDNLGELLGRYFVAQKFSPLSKQIAQQLIKEVELAFASNLPQVDWMDNQTRIASAQKLSMMSNLVGYPCMSGSWRSGCR
jgi:putative endopeptidase